MDGGGFCDKIAGADRLSELLGDALREYNDNNPVMDLVLHPTARGCAFRWLLYFGGALAPVPRWLGPLHRKPREAQ